jgi:hypothetical protein
VLEAVYSTSDVVPLLDAGRGLSAGSARACGAAPQVSQRFSSAVLLGRRLAGCGHGWWRQPVTQHHDQLGPCI